ncbi:MAG: hypothetical protein LUG55_03410 [Clostridiales bacterium]|nr:hypothetical protein [Clostridiales bacterium]
MLDQIEEALKAAFDLPVYYGTSAEATGSAVYDYIVFWRDKATWKSGSKGDYTNHCTVALVRQNFIPEEETLTVIDALRDIPGLRETGDGITYSCLTKPGTALALEVAEYHFFEARKRVS